MKFEEKFELPCGDGKVEFKNRIVRSSLGGRMAYYDGTANNAWKNFEYHFAKNGIAAIISATISVHPNRHSPLEYPQLDHDKFIGPLKDGVEAVKKFGCRYIVQLGDCGSHMQSSLFSNATASESSSAGFDFLYGFRNFRTEMTKDNIKREIEYFAAAARRVVEIGCDGIELTAAKGYLIHQFLNPGVNRRRDEYGEDRFLFLDQVARAIRETVGRNFLFGVRIAAQDFNYRPLNLRWPGSGFGNGLDQMIEYAKRLKAKPIEINFLHVTNGFGFISPHDNPGDFPLAEATMFCDATRHLSRKAAIRAFMMHTPIKYLVRMGWKRMPPGSKLPDTLAMKRAVDLPVIVNGGFQERELIESALEQGCDLVSIARPLIANPDLYHILRKQPKPDNPCSFCNRCDVRTSMFPVGCYDPARFGHDYEAMERQIMQTSANPVWPHPAQCVRGVCVD